LEFVVGRSILIASAAIILWGLADQVPWRITGFWQGAGGNPVVRQRPVFV